jgi:hypothetical protein
MGSNIPSCLNKIHLGIDTIHKGVPCCDVHYDFRIKDVRFVFTFGSWWEG